MATYVYRCTGCGAQKDWWAPIGEGPPVHRCDECDANMVKVLGVGLAIHSSATPNKHADVRAADAREARWARDHPAYRRAREKGLQPTTVDGYADIEDRIGDQMDIDYANIMPREEKDREPFKEAISETLESMTPHPAIVKP